MNAIESALSMLKVMARDLRAVGLNQPRKPGFLAASSWLPSTDRDPAGLQGLDHPLGLRAVADVVAQAEDGGDPPGVDVGQHLLKCVHVAVDVGQHGDLHDQPRYRRRSPPKVRKPEAMNFMFIEAALQLSAAASRSSNV